LTIAEVVASSHMRTRVTGTLAALKLTERASFLIANVSDGVVIAVAADRALVLLRQQILPMMRGGGYSLEVEAFPWSSVRGFRCTASAYVGETAEDVYVSPQAKFDEPELTIEPGTNEEPDAALDFIAACIESLAPV
jgi:hypothetical protein